MFELTYSSFANPLIDKEQINHITTKSKVYNTLNGITGCLVFHNKEFVQILEGKEAVVRNLFAKIKTDHRHRGISLLASGAIKQKQFKGWNAISDSTYGLDFNQRIHFENNLRELAKLADKNTKASSVFWNYVYDLSTKNIG